MAAHRETNFTVAVEAKARNRRPSDRNPATTGVYDLVENAAHKASAKRPFALFVDVAMPPEDAAAAPKWTNEVDEIVKAVVAKHGGMPGPFDWVLFTSIGDETQFFQRRPHRSGLRVNGVSSRVLDRELAQLVERELRPLARPVLQQRPQLLLEQVERAGR